MIDQTTHKGLLEPILDQGISNTNYFNGRLLTAQDLKADQDANRRQHQQLGRGIGEGVVSGFEVRLVSGGTSTSPPAIEVKRGLALTRAGHAVELPFDVPELLLARRNPDIAPTAGLFAECARPTNETVTTTSTSSVHILVVSPASGFVGKAPKRGLGENGKVEGCGSRFVVEGVYFRLVELRLSDLPFLSAGVVVTLTSLMNQTDAASLSKLRNLLAHVCFGTEELADFPNDPFRLVNKASPFTTYGALDDLRASGALTDCDVPLALVFWGSTGVRFVDMWSARRRIVQPVVGDPWPLHVGERRLAESEAIFLQFQDQLLATAAESGLPSLRAVDRLRFLPAAGYLPIDSGEFTVAAFFQGLQRTDIDVDSAFLRLIVHDAWFLEPIDLSDPPPILIYRSADHPDYIVFARGARQPAPTAEQPSAGQDQDASVATGRITVDVSIEKAAIKAKQASGSAGEEDIYYIAAKVYESIGVVGPNKTYKVANAIGKQDVIDLIDGKTDFQPKNIKVVARDAQGIEHPAKYTRSRFEKRLGQIEGISFEDGTARFVIDALDPGTYQVIVQAKGFMQAQKSATVTSGKTTAVTFDLVLDSKQPTGPATKPSQTFDAGWIKQGWFDKVYMVEPLIQWPWPEPEERVDFDPLDDPLPDPAQEWVLGWANWLQAAYPEAPVDPGDIQIYLSKAHTPDATPDAAYAYAVFGEQGAYFPIILAPVDRSLDRDVPVDKGGLAGVDREVASKMESYGLMSVDTLAASWTGLVADILEVDTDAAGSVISEARDQVDSLQSSLLIFNGVDSTLNDALAQANIDSPVALANSSPDDLVAALGEAGLMTPAFAERLVSQARQTVPAEQWSLASPQLGLKSDEIDSLEALGITTLNQFKTMAASDAELNEIAGALNVSAEQVRTLRDQIVIKSAADLVTERRAAGSITNVFGVSRETGSALINLGLSTVGDLARADAAAVAAAFGGNRDMAASAINNARARIGVNQ